MLDEAAGTYTCELFFPGEVILLEELERREIHYFIEAEKMIGKPMEYYCSEILGSAAPILSGGVLTKNGDEESLLQFMRRYQSKWIIDDMYMRLGVQQGEMLHPQYKNGDEFDSAFREQLSRLLGDGFILVSRAAQIAGVSFAGLNTTITRENVPVAMARNLRLVKRTWAEAYRQKRIDKHR